jgi:DNA-binding NtrC family response regulator
MYDPPTVLVAEDQPLLQWALGRALATIGADVTAAATYDDACAQLARRAFAAVVVASPLEGRSIAGILKDVDRLRPETRLVVLCAGDHCEHLLREIPRATLFCKPFAVSELLAALAPALAAPVRS